VRGVWLVVLFSGVACSERAVDSGQGSAAGNELIPAEWTVFEDTSRTGEVITASLQLPAAKDIEGLLEGEAPRLILRCVDGKVEASIDREPAATAEARSDSTAVSERTVRIELDSAPACE
jgi:hypothetical protein